jgi:hypothetical protein
MARPRKIGSLSLLCALGVAAVGYSGFANAQASLDAASIIEQSQGAKLLPHQLATSIPTTPNPWTSLRPDGANVDWNYWEARRYQSSIAKAAQNKPAKLRLTGSGQGTLKVSKFGTGPSQANTVQIAGEFSLPPASVFVQDAEDEGSIPLASETGLTAGNAIVASGIIGDGAFGLAGTGSGDFDFYAIRDASAGATIVVDVDTELPFAPLDPAVAVYNAAGQIIAFNDDSGGTYDSFVSVSVPADGDYFVSIGTFGNPVLNDPFDSSTGNGVEQSFYPEGNEGTYSVLIGLDYFDEQLISFTPKKGDVVGAAINGTLAELELVDHTGTVRQGSKGPSNSIFDTGTPLPAGIAEVGHVVDTPGLFTLRVRGNANGLFTLDLASYVPELRTADRGEKQIIFLDFDGATVDLCESIFSCPPPPFTFERTLSPLVDFLPNWGLTAADEDAVIDAIVARVIESLDTDLDWLGPNPKFEIEIRNSRDHADPWGEQNVSRVIVGGSRSQLLVNTIGIAQSIDVGNYDTEETAFVLLDLLSGELPSSVNLNNIPRAPGVGIIDIIGVGVGEITAHEAGHYLGCWHTDQFNPIANIMDQGGNLNFSILGLGPDGIFGTADDTNVQFVRDEFNPNEGFTGIEDNQSAIAFGTTEGRSK